MFPSRSPPAVHHHHHLSDQGKRSISNVLTNHLLSKFNRYA
jgi:hypothetical protein